MVVTVSGVMRRTVMKSRRYACSLRILAGLIAALTLGSMSSGQAQSSGHLKSGPHSPFAAVYNATFHLSAEGAVTRKVISGKGFSTAIGQSLALFEGTLAPAPDGAPGFVIQGTTTFTDLAGDKLVAETTGRIRPAEAEAGLVQLDYQYVFEGGTGRFALARGNAHVLGTARFQDATSGTATWCMEGDLQLGFKAAYDHTFTLAPREEGSRVFNKEITGKGFNTVIGESAARFTGTIDLSSAPYPIDGTTTFTDLDGDELHARTTGHVIPNDKDPTLVELDYRCAFTGGTGKFVGASGNARVLGAAVFVDQVSGTASWCLDGDLSLVERAPSMNAKPEAQGIRVSWTQTGGRWGVQRSDDLSNWQSAPAGARQNGLRRSVRLEADRARQFLRLTRTGE